MITKEIIDKRAMKRIPRTMASKLNIVMGRDETDSLVVFTDKITVDKQLYLNLVFSREFKFKKIEKRQITNLLKEYNQEREKFIISENYVEKELDKLIENAIKKGSSDIHVEPEKFYSNIRFRINGELIAIDRISIDEHNSIINRIKVLSNMDIANKLEPQDGKLAINIGLESFDIRVSSIPTTNGEKIVLRILYKNEELNRIENLNFSKAQNVTLRKLLALKKGMIIVSGPTGAGKSTTLYACLNELDKARLNISTVEDPVEFDLLGITQINVNEKIGFDFSKALKYILRQDPDVILVGEIRDEDTAKMAIRSAITGHKVLSTIHTSSGREVYHRFLNMGVDRYLLDDALAGVITQRLIKTLCVCKIEEEILFEQQQIKAYKACGCEVCNNTGYSGRTAIIEVIDLSNKDNIKWGEQMVFGARRLLLEGKISLADYLIFNEGEGLDY
ncbi:MAG: GspE/PulE family protein [Sarcina sp.]